MLTMLGIQGQQTHLSGMSVLAISHFWGGGGVLNQPHLRCNGGMGNLVTRVLVSQTTCAVAGTPSRSPVSPEQSSGQGQREKVSCDLYDLGFSDPHESIPHHSSFSWMLVTEGGELQICKTCQCFPAGTRGHISVNTLILAIRSVCLLVIF